MAMMYIMEQDRLNMRYDNNVRMWHLLFVTEQEAQQMLR